MNMKMKPDHRERLLELGISNRAAERALKLLSAQEPSPEGLAERVETLVLLARSCGNVQNAKLAYSLAGRSGVTLNRDSALLLAQALRCCECVPAAVRLWKTASDHGISDPVALATAARLGQDGATQIRVLNLLKNQSKRLKLAAELSRQLCAPGWESDGSWGAVSDPERGLVWWDNAAAGERRSFGMTLTSDELDLSDLLGVKFQFEFRHQILGTTDRCHLEVSTNGRLWHKLRKFEGQTDWQTAEIDLSKYHGETIFLRFHVLSGGQREGRGIEIAKPRLLAHRCLRRAIFEFPETAGWHQEGEGITQVLHGTESEVDLESEPQNFQSRVSPTVVADAKMASSSVYGEARIDILDETGDVCATETLNGSGDWSQVRLEVPHSVGSSFRLRLSSRFAKRKDEDGFWLRNLSLKSGTAESFDVLALDGGHDDGVKERKALLALLEDDSERELEKLARLRQGLPSLKLALALAAMLETEDQIPALLKLFSSLKEEAVHAFGLLKDLASGEDLCLQSDVLLVSGIENYPSTRDHLGDGLLPASEFEENCELYLKLRQSWSEEQARRGFSLLLTPLADEDGNFRRERFVQLLSGLDSAEELFAAWDAD